MIRRNIPNGITALNLILGMVALLLLGKGEFLLACWVLAGAGLADFLDGLAARALRVQSEMGIQLDSLADMVSFGLVPGFIYFQLLSQSSGSTALIPALALPACLVPVFSALRLARFNLDQRQRSGFMGLPTPANTLLAVGILLIFLRNPYGLGSWAGSYGFLYPVIGLSCWLLIAEIPLFGLKFKTLSWRGNEIRIIFVLASGLLLLVFQEVGLVAIIVLYILLSVLFKSNVVHEIPGGN
jgi:CDP-diacylglycerol--serine O-phosphatidyltransferase